MTRDYYLLDTHALIFWHNQVSLSKEFLDFLDKQEQIGTLHVSSISFWEIALLVKKQKLALPDVHAWKNELLNNTHITIIEPSVTEMINSTLLPDYHKDPFDRLLIAQATQHDLILVTQDQYIEKYEVKRLWR